MKNAKLIFLIAFSACISKEANSSVNGFLDPDLISLPQNKKIAETIKDKSGKPVILVPYSLHWEDSKNSKLNLSFLLEKPAGRDGFITVKNGHFVKPSGERFKIWGVNMTGGACFPEKKDAALVAAFLARFGINAVRLHFLDSNWGQERSLFNFSLTTTRELSAVQLDKLDFFIAELKKAGIYSDINLNVAGPTEKMMEYQSTNTWDLEKELHYSMIVL